MAYVQSEIKISGLNEVVAGLKAMGAQKELLALNLKVGKFVVNEAVQLVPIGKTGHLQASIKTVRSLNGVVVRAGQDPDIPYANPQNWGWFYDRKNFVQKNIMPTQFMNKAAAKVRSRIGEFYMKDLLAIYDKYSKQTFTGKVNLNRDLFDSTTRKV